MARIPERWDGANQWYFVTVATKHREPVFKNEIACSVLKSAFHEVHKYYSFRLAGLSILPDHWHGLFRPSEGVVIENIIGAVKQNVLTSLNRLHSSFWQSRFIDHRVRDEDDFNYHMEYIRLNAVKHELVQEVEEFKWYFLHENPFGDSKII